MKSEEKRLTVAITGASGSVYAVRFLKSVVPHYEKIFLIVSETACEVMKAELGLDFPNGEVDSLSLVGEHCENAEILPNNDLTAPPSSGSVCQDGMVVIPCSMGTAGRIASGVSNDLISRAADVCLKERRKLILVARETPLNLIHLRNLTTLAEAGAVILPASPGFYHNPATIDDLADFVVGKALQQLGLNPETPEWKPEK